VYVDTVGPPKKYKEKLERTFDNYNIEFTVESKADSKYQCVSAASIVAKYHRDRLLKEWKF
jgi:ribonuclease H2 subunit A